MALEMVCREWPVCPANSPIRGISSCGFPDAVLDLGADEIHRADVTARIIRG
jgi:hypothetical protein